MSGTSGDRTQRELVLIVRDAHFVRRMIEGYGRAPGGGSPYVPFFIFNHMTLFVYEASRWFARNAAPGLSEIISGESLATIRRSRHSVKLFDDNTRGVDGLGDYFMEVLTPLYERHFTDMVRVRLLRFLATDLGLTFYQGRLVMTTHAAHFYVGLPDDLSLGAPNLQDEIQRVPIQYGRFVGALTDAFPVEGGGSFAAYLSDGDFASKDVLSRRYYRHVLGTAEIPPGVVGALMALRASLNFLTHVLSLDDEPQSRGTTFKMRYISAYHAISSLRSLVRSYGSALPAESLKQLRREVDSSFAQVVVSREGRYLRNTLTHYGINRRVPIEALPVGHHLCGLAEHFLPWGSFDDASEYLARQLAGLAATLDDISSDA